MLREDNSGTPRSSDSSRGPSLDGFDKALAAEKSKDDKKKKERKPGMLSGLFKRKDKKDKGRNNEDDTSDHEKVSGEILRGTSPKDSNDVSPTERRPSDSDVAQRDRRVSSRGKLQKVKTDGTVNKGRPVNADDSAEPLSRSASKASTHDMTVGPTLRAVDDDGGNSSNYNQNNTVQPREDAVLSDQTKALKHQEPANDTDAADNNPNKPKEFGSSRNPQKGQELQGYSRSAQERLSDSPVRISPSEVVGVHSTSALSADKRNQEIKDSPSTSSSSSQSFVEVQNSESPKKMAPSESNGSENLSKAITSAKTQSEPFSEHSTHQKQASVASQLSSQDSVASSSNPSYMPSPRLPDWSDASLLTYIDDDSDIRDLLLLINDKSKMTPIGPEHPVATEMFRAERGTLSEMGQKLDEMLGSWMMKKAKHNNDDRQQTVKISG